MRLFGVKIFEESIVPLPPTYGMVPYVFVLYIQLFSGVRAYLAIAYLAIESLSLYIHPYLERGWYHLLNLCVERERESGSMSCALSL